MIERWHHPACLEPDELLKLCEISTGRSGGPGGQHRNKVETLVNLRHRDSGVEAHAGERRSQVENKRMAISRLRHALAVQVRVSVPLGEIGSALWRSRCAAGKIACNPEHEDYPAMLAEAMDVLAAAGWEPPRAALRLGCSPTQLVRHIKEYPPALSRVNAERKSAGKHALR